MKQYTWSNNKNDELWQHDIFSSKEECIADAKENYEIKSGETIAIGVSIPYVVNVDAERVLENLEEQAFEQCGEACEGWIDYKHEDIIRLSNALSDCVNAWLKETKQEPNFWQVDDIETVVID